MSNRNLLEDIGAQGEFIRDLRVNKPHKKQQLAKAVAAFKKMKSDALKTNPELGKTLQQDLYKLSEVKHMNTSRRQSILEKLAFTKESKLQSFIKARLSGAGLLKSVNRGSVPSIKELRAAGLSNEQALRVAQHAHGREAAALHGMAKKAPKSPYAHYRAAQPKAGEPWSGPDHLRAQQFFSYAKRNPLAKSRGVDHTYKAERATSKGQRIASLRRDRDVYRSIGMDKAPRGSAEREFWRGNEIGYRRHLLKLKKPQPGTRG